MESFDHIPGVQANFTVDEFVECDELVRKHPDFIAALAKRGITDMDLVFVDTWTYGDAVAPPEYRDRRIGWSDTWRKDGPGQSPYAHPISGLHCVIDVNSMELLRVEDNGGVEEPERHGRVRAQAHPGTDPCGVAARAAQAVAPHAARRACRSPSTATCCSGRTGRCGSGSTTARE